MKAPDLRSTKNSQIQLVLCYIFGESSHSALCHTSVFLIKVLVHFGVRLFFAEGFSKVFKSLTLLFISGGNILLSLLLSSLLLWIFPSKIAECCSQTTTSLLNHIIEEKRVKNLDDCELMCYLNDNCVSFNFKKDPENNEPVHICEPNNATHLKYDNDLTTDANFYYRGSKVSYRSVFRNRRLKIIWK